MATAGKTQMSAAQAARTTEVMVGITEYASAHKGFRGTLKYRYSDFIVREVSQAMEVVKLTDNKKQTIALPPADAAAAAEAAAAASAAAASASAATAAAASLVAGGAAAQVKEEVAVEGAVSAVGVREMEALVGKELVDKIVALVSKAKEDTPSKDKKEDLKAWEVVLEPNADKATRTAVHKCVRAHFAPLESDSVKVGDTQVTAVRIFHPRGNSGQWREGALRGREVSRGGAAERPHKRQRTDQADPVKVDAKYKYVRFTLFKENKDTMGAISELCRHTQLPSKKFAYAGSKDRRACTAQHVTIPRADSRHILGVNRRIKFGMQLGDFMYCEDPLRLGKLYGNRFELALRDVEADPALLMEACESLKSKGFINYYGLQRFGTSAVATHDIGRAILLDDFATAADLILRPRAGEKEESTGVRLRYQTEKDAKKALTYFPRYMHAERSVLEGYSKHGKASHVHAVQSLPRNMRLMYVHAYQSYIWNMMTGARIRQHGLDKAVEGDLVLVDPATEEAAALDGEPLQEDEKDTKGWTVAHPKSVKALTAEEAATTSIFDVVLPLPGTSIMYPSAKGVTKDDYGLLMKEDGLDVEKMEHKAKEFTLAGDYRRIKARADDLSWERISYKDPYADLQATDNDELCGRNNTKVRAIAMSGKKQKRFGADVETQEAKEANQERTVEEVAAMTERTALIIAFTLRSSTYATMCIRELLKEHSEEAALGLRNTDTATASGEKEVKEEE